MFLFYGCRQCNFLARVDGREDELDLLVMESSHSCPKCGGQLARTGCTAWRGITARRFSFADFYKAINGLGLPEETVTHKEPVVAMLKACRILDVDASEVAERCIIHRIILDNGVILHLAASGYGAAVFKATRRNSDASFGTKVNDDEQPVRGLVVSKEHDSGSDPLAGAGGEVHRRLRQDADAVGGDDRGSAIPSACQDQ